MTDEQSIAIVNHESFDYTSHRHRSSVSDISTETYPFLYHSFLKHELAQPFISLNNLLFSHKSKHSENMTVTLLSHNKIYMAENKIVQDVKFLIKIVDFNKARQFFPSTFERSEF